jgi:hypothetical protein
MVIAEEGTPINVGPDRLYKTRDRLVVTSRDDMPDWSVRAYRRTQIVFDEQPYFVARRDGPADGRFTYVLEPWTEELRDLPGKVIHYDGAYVAERDSVAERQSKLEMGRLLLLPFTPLVGLLFSRTKLRVEQVFGISARRATFLSIWFELAVFFMLGLAAWAQTYGGLYATATGGTLEVPLGAASALDIVVLIDVVMRYSSMLRDDPAPIGFLEWVFRRRR